MRQLGITCIVFLVAFCTHAQKDMKSVINKVKKSDKYIYGEATMSSKEEAYALAEELLYANINDYIEQSKKNTSSNVIVRNFRDELSMIDLPRGNMIRAFIYVEKKDIIPADNVVIFEQETTDPIVENSSSSQEEIANIEVVEVTVQERSRLPQEIFEKVTAINTFSEIQHCLESLNNTGKIAHYDKYAAVKDHSTDYYLIVYNREGKVVAILGRGENERLNLKTGREDALSNYKGCGAICFKIKE